MSWWPFGKKKQPSSTPTQPSPPPPPPPAETEYVRNLRLQQAAAERERQEAAARLRQQQKEAEQAYQNKARQRLLDVKQAAEKFMSTPDRLKAMENAIAFTAKTNPAGRKFDFTRVIRGWLVDAELFDGREWGDEHTAAIEGAYAAISPFLKEKGLTVTLHNNNIYQFHTTETRGQYDAEWPVVRDIPRRGISISW